ncbi:MAG: cation-transporting P-type ATPase [Acidimicrobiia bacterium]
MPRPRFSWCSEAWPRTGSSGSGGRPSGAGGGAERRRQAARLRALPDRAARSRRCIRRAEALGTDCRDGLTATEAAERLGAVGPNVLARAERPRYSRIAARQLADPLVALLLVAAAVSAGIGERLEAGVIGAIVLLNACLGFVQEAGAERALLALSRTRELSSTVVRDGRERTGCPTRESSSAAGRCWSFRSIQSGNA